MESPTGFLHTNQESSINANAGPGQTYAFMLLTWVNCTHVFRMLQARWSCRYKVGYRPRAKRSLQVFNRSGRHFSAEKQENFWSVRKLTTLQRFGTEHINRWDISAHTEPCQVWLHARIKYINRMLIHIKRSWSHKDATLHFYKKKENIPENYTISRNLEEQLMWTYSNQELRNSLL